MSESDTLLRSKLTVPPYRAGLISRPRLIARLEAGFDGGVRLILISAPAGSGKSTLAGEWAARSLAAVRFAWLSLDPADNQNQRFWLYLIGALRAVLPDLGQAEQRLLSFPQAPPLETILTGLLNGVGDRPERLVLIVDDYHLIVEPSIHEGMTFLLEHLPANLQLVLATRADPPLPLSRLRVRNQLLEIRAADLFFTLPESEILINDVMGLGLSAGHLAALEQRTEGWAAGIQLAAIILTDERRKAGEAQDEAQVGERLTALVRRLSGRQHLIADYLLDEVFNRQSAEVQRFLLDSSILDELCASLCDALSENGEGIPGAQAILETLERANLFLIPLEDAASASGGQTWFRYHHLFADALRIRLERTRPGAASSLHQRASRWYEKNGPVEKAIEHALAAQDHDRAASLIEANAYAINRQGRYAALSRWLEQIPARTLLAHPRISIWGSRALALAGKLSEAEQQLQAIEAACANAPAPLTPELRGQMAAVRAIAAILSADTVLAKEQSQQAIDLLPPGDPSLAAVLQVSGTAALMSGEIQPGIQLLQEAVARCRQNNDLSTMMTAYAHLAVGVRMQGKLRQVETVCLEALDEVHHQLGAGDWPLPTLAAIYDRLAAIKREWDDLAGAEQALARAIRISENCAYLSGLVNAYGGLAAVRRSQGNLPQAIELVEKCLQSIHRRESTLYLDLCQALRAEYWVYAGNLAAARGWAEERNITAGHTLDYTGEGELYTLARLWIAEGRADEAEAIAGRLIATAKANGQPGNTIPYLVLQALARRAAGRLDLAAQSLEQALLLGEPEGFLRTFLDEGDLLLDLLHRLTRQKSKASAYARLLLAKLEPAAVQEQGHSPSIAPKMPLVEPLTDRELVVLRQMAAGSSNQEIAERLVISVGTVKAHIYHITAKLGARSRTEAVARARDAGLIP
jgi:LuxR family transcriptional regulator, maltose regulon positive regulatory protein